MFSFCHHIDPQQSTMWLLFFSDQILFQREPALCACLSTGAAADLWELWRDKKHDKICDAETHFRRI